MEYSCLKRFVVDNPHLKKCSHAAANNSRNIHNIQAHFQNKRTSFELNFLMFSVFLLFLNLINKIIENNVIINIGFEVFHRVIKSLCIYYMFPLRNRSLNLFKLLVWFHTHSFWIRTYRSWLWLLNVHIAKRIEKHMSKPCNNTIYQTFAKQKRRYLYT